MLVAIAHCYEVRIGARFLAMLPILVEPSSELLVVRVDKAVRDGKMVRIVEACVFETLEGVG
jgi:hypothetical protein